LLVLGRLNLDLSLNKVPLWSLLYNKGRNKDEEIKVSSHKKNNEIQGNSKEKFIYSLSAHLQYSNICKKMDL